VGLGSVGDKDSGSVVAVVGSGSVVVEAGLVVEVVLVVEEVSAAGSAAAPRSSLASTADTLRTTCRCLRSCFSRLKLPLDLQRCTVVFELHLLHSLL